MLRMLTGGASFLFSTFTRYSKSWWWKSACCHLYNCRTCCPLSTGPQDKVVTHAIHVRDPNINPNWPRSLEGKSKRLGASKSDNIGCIEGVCASQILNSKHGDAIVKTYLQTEGNREMSKATKVWGAWAQILRNIALHPEMHKDVLLQVTGNAVVIQDKYPKGKHHLLVVAREYGLDSMLDLKSCHLQLLEHMHSLGETLAVDLLKQDRSLVFRLGYHSDPSMRQLHLHVISQDFDSPFLNNKKHWNSFTTHFFRDSKDVIEELRQFGKVTPSCHEESLQKIELRCNRCHTIQPNIPRLKYHIRSCQMPYSPSLIMEGYLLTASCLDNSTESSCST